VDQRLRARSAMLGSRASGQQERTPCRERAYEIWEHTGRPEGKAVEHWLQAEAETAAEEEGLEQEVELEAEGVV
jgi:hypothetical protein